MTMCRVVQVLLLLVQLIAVSGVGTVRGVRNDGITATTTTYTQRRLMMGGKMEKEEYEEYEEDYEEEEEEEEYEAKASKSGGMKSGMASGSVPKGSMMMGSSAKGGMGGMKVSATAGTMIDSKTGKSTKSKGKDAKKQKKLQDMTMMNKLAKSNSEDYKMSESKSKKSMKGVKGMTITAAVGTMGMGMYSESKDEPKSAMKKQKRSKGKSMMNKLGTYADDMEAYPDEPEEPISIDESLPTEEAMPVDAEPTDAPTFSSVGGDVDEYGCLPSAGYVWCPELEECIQPFAQDCPVDGTVFEGPTTLDCTDDMRCSLNEDCTIDVGSYTIGGPYITGLGGSAELPEGCVANCVGCTEEDLPPGPEEEFSIDEVPTMAPTILPMPETDAPVAEPPMDTPAPTFSETDPPREVTDAPTFSSPDTEAPVAVEVAGVGVNFTLRFGFFQDAAVTEPTQEDLDAVTEQVNLFYNHVLGNSSEEFLGFEAYVINTEFDEEAVFPVTVDYEGVALYSGTEAPTQVELLSTMEAADYQVFITEYVWEANSVLFFDTQSVFFTSALDADGPGYGLPTVGPEPEITPTMPPLPETDAPVAPLPETDAPVAALPETDAPTMATAPETPAPTVEETAAQSEAPREPETDVPGTEPEPVEPLPEVTDPPAEVTDAPMEVTDAAPVQVTDPPMEVTEPPIEVVETEPPMEVTDAPVEVDPEIPEVDPELPEVVETDAPMEVTDPPIEVETEPPMEVTEPPMEVTDAAPVEVTDPPVEVTDAPMEVTDAPAEVEPEVPEVVETDAPATEVPVVLPEPEPEATETPVAETEAPAEPEPAVTETPEEVVDVVETEAPVEPEPEPVPEPEATATPETEGPAVLPETDTGMEMATGMPDGATSVPESMPEEGVMTLPAEEGAADGDNPRVLEASMDFGFFEGTEIREPTPEEVDGLVVQINNFYTDVLDTSFDNFATFEASVVNSSLVNETVGVDFDAFVFFEPGTESPSPFEVLSVMEGGDYTSFITNYVWNVTMDSIFYQTQSVQFYARI